MNHRLLSLALFTVLTPLAGLANPIVAPSKISTVTVYGSGALVTREAEVELPAGMHIVVFQGLPESLDPDLLQVSGEGTASATILDVRAVPSQLEAPANARLKELRDQARTIEAAQRALNDRGAVLLAQRDYYERIKQATVAPHGGKDAAPATLPTVATWEQFITFYTDGISKVLTATQALDREREDTKARLDALQRQIAELDAPETRSVTDVAVRLNVAAPGTMRLTVAYTVHEARWRPTYDVRVTSADKSIRLDYGASVSQSTGEDWTGVKLQLSTARPDRHAVPPELPAWIVDQFTPPPPMPTATRERDKMLTYQQSPEIGYVTGNFAGASTLESRGLAIDTASVQAGLNAATFTIPYAADIPADNASHKVVITSAPLSGEINHLAIPKLAERAYLRAAVTNTTEFPLIGGEIAIFLDGAFVARSRVPTVAPTEKFVLELGADDALSVKRKLVNRLREDTGLISKRVKITYDVLITVQNNRATPENLVVRDQVPISRHEKIIITLIEPPAREITRDEDGTIRWSLDLKPGEKRELALKITVEHPVDLQVTGLD